MYIIIWEYQVKLEHVRKFEEIYSASGAWAELFKKAEGFVSTELLHHTGYADLYLTIDRWLSSDDYKVFLSRWQTEYARLDAECEGLTVNETLLGKWELILTET